MDQVGSHRAGLPDRRYEARFSGEPARWLPGAIGQPEMKEDIGI